MNEVVLKQDSRLYSRFARRDSIQRTSRKNWNGHKNDKVRFDSKLIKWLTPDIWSNMERKLKYIMCIIIMKLVVHICYQFRVPRNLRIDIKNIID